MVVVGEESWVGKQKVVVYEYFLHFTLHSELI